jgi:DNA-binding beta-propeller fold protein YncE
VALDAVGRIVRISRRGSIEMAIELAYSYEPLDIAAGVIDGHEIIIVSLFLKDTSVEFSRLAIYRDGKPVRTLSLPGPGWYSGLALDPSTKTLYMTNTNSSEVFKLSLVEAALKKSYVVSVPGKVIGPVAVDSVRQRLFTADVARGTLYTTTLANRKVQVLAKVDGEPAALTFEPSSERLYVVDAAGSRIWLLELKSNPVAPKLFAAGQGLNDPRGIAVDASGNLYVANKGSGTILAFDKSGKLFMRY